MDDKRITIRPAGLGDEDILLLWRNDLLTREMSFSQNLISRQEHHEWFRRVLNDAGRYIFIGEFSGKRIGMIRLDSQPGGWYRVNITMAPEWRQKGLGKVFLISCLDMFVQRWQSFGFIAEVLPYNEVSKCLFKSVGFEEKTESENKILFRLRV